LAGAVLITDYKEVFHHTHLQVRRWQSESHVCSTVAVLCLHGIESHGGWFEEFAKITTAKGVDCIYYDRIGNGLNLKADVQTLDSMLCDLKSIFECLQKQYAHVVILGMSWGGLLAASAIQRNIIAPRFSILMVPGIFSLKSLPLSDFIRTLRNLIFSLKNEVPIPIGSEDFSLKADVRTIIERDSLRRKSAPARLLFDTLKLRSLVRRSRLPKDSVEVWLAESDRIIDNDSLIKYLKRHGIPFELFENHGHALIFECPDKLSDLLLQRVKLLGIL